MKKGSLVIVGTGIKFASHLTAEAEGHIKQAEKLFYVIPGPLSDDWMKKLNATAESLTTFYADDRRRLDTYAQMVATIMAAVRQGTQVCAVFYGHPGVFVLPAHEAIRQARAEGYAAQMLPGVSAEDCLFADLGIDPAVHGCQSYEATDFLVRRRRFDPLSHLVLWQVGVIGEAKRQKAVNSRGLKMLTAVLLLQYEIRHRVVIYEAAQYPIYDPVIQSVPLASLPDAPMTPRSTLYVPPKAAAPIDPAVMAELGLTMADIQFSKV